MQDYQEIVMDKFGYISKNGKNIKMNFRDLIYQVDSLECAVYG